MRRPNIINETSTGVRLFGLSDIMLANRELELTGSVDPETAGELISAILYLARLDPEEEITLYINSPGGEVSSGLALYDVMRAVPCPIHTVCLSAASMAALLFAAGDRRDILPHGRVLIHDPSSRIGGSVAQIGSVFASLLETRETIANLLAEHTHKSVEEVQEAMAAETSFCGKNAVDFGLADHVLEGGELV